MALNIDLSGRRTGFPGGIGSGPFDPSGGGVGGVNPLLNPEERFKSQMPLTTTATNPLGIKATGMETMATPTAIGGEPVRMTDFERAPIRPAAITSSQILTPDLTGTPAKTDVPTEGETRPVATPTTVKPAETPTEKEDKPKAVDTGGEVIVPASDSAEVVVNVEQTDPGQRADTNLQAIIDIVMKMAKGEITDPVFNKALNNYISNISLYNQADMEALSQQIAQDPNLRGTGLGYALLAQAGREAGFRVSDMLGKLTIDSAQRLMDLQKFGINQVAKLDEIRYGRETSAINSLIATGDYAGAAALANQRFNRDFPGLGITVSESSIAARDPYMQDMMRGKISLAKDVATTDPIAATGIIQSIMDDPVWADVFPEGMTAEQIVDAFRTGQFIENQGIVSEFDEKINTSALDGETFDEVEGYYNTLDKLGLRNFLKEGQNLDLEKINATREFLGLPNYTEDAEGNILDQNGNLITEDDFRELGMQNDYRERVEEGKEVELFNPIWDSFTKDPRFAELIKNDPEVMRTMKDYAYALDAATKGVGPMRFDETTNQMVPIIPEDPMSDPDWAPLFNSWPKAVFDSNTNEVVGDYYSGGDPYWLADAGFDLAVSSDDKNLDKAFYDYRSRGGELGMNQWYFASAGGKFKPGEAGFDEGRVPEEIKDFEPEVSTVTSITDFEKMIAGGGVPTTEDIKVLPNVNAGNLPYGSGWETSELASVGNYINLQGTGFKIVGGAESEKADHLYLEGMDGQLYMLIGEGSGRDWFKIEKIPQTIDDILNAEHIEPPIGKE